MSTTADQAAARLAASRMALLQALRQGAPSSSPGNASPPHWPIAWRLAGAAASGTVSSVARWHPWLLVGGAAMAGGLMVTPYPWRWALRPPLVLGLLARLAWRHWSTQGHRTRP